MPSWSGIGGQKVYFLENKYLLVTTAGFYNEGSKFYKQCGQIRKQIEIILSNISSF